MNPVVNPGEDSAQIAKLRLRGSPYDNFDARAFLLHLSTLVHSGFLETFSPLALLPNQTNVRGSILARRIGYNPIDCSPVITEPLLNQTSNQHGKWQPPLSSTRPPPISSTSWLTLRTATSNTRPRFKLSRCYIFQKDKLHFVHSKHIYVKLCSNNLRVNFCFCCCNVMTLGSVGEKWAGD